MRQENVVRKRSLLLRDGGASEVGIHSQVDGVEDIKFHIGIFGFPPRVGDLKREVVMAKSEGFTGPVQDLSMAPDIEAFSPSVVERLGSDGVETANQFHIIAGEEHVVLRVGLDGRVDGTNLDVGVE